MESLRSVATNTVVRWGAGAVITIALALAVAFTSRNVYSKEEVDLKIEVVDTKVEYIHENVKWLVRTSGGVPADVDSN